MPAPISPRKRRLRRTLLIIAVAFAAAALLGLIAYRSTRTATRTPGEDLDDITSRLSLDLPEEAPTPRFTDVTIEAGLGGFRTFNGRRTSQLPEDMGSGAAWGDFDGDGDDDLFLVAAGGSLDLADTELAPSELYENLGDGSFRLFAGFPETRIFGMAAAWGDFDNDGKLDLAVSGYHSLLLFHNEGDRFVRVDWLDIPDITGNGYWAGLAWVDFDNDSDLDLYVCGYVRYEVETRAAQSATEQYGTTVPYTLNPASFEAESNLLFRNRLDEGVVGFAEEALLWGISNPEGRSLSALWHDLNADGWPDLYVANDISDNALYMNRLEDGGTFEDEGLASWVADYRGAMGLAAGDWNRDGDDDLFVTHWVAQENALYDARFLTPPNGKTSGSPARIAFSDLAAPLGLGQIALQMVGWGTEFADFDADGWLDIIVANGSTFENDDETRTLRQQKPFLMWNQTGKAFHDLAPLSPELSEASVSRGLALSDYDLDGDLDILTVQLDGGVHLLRNDMEHANWLEIRLLRETGKPIEGTTVTAWIGDVPLRRSTTGNSYLSQSSRVLHFGLGDALSVDRVEVHWSGNRSGVAEEYPALEAGSRWQLKEGNPAPTRDPDSVKFAFDSSAPALSDHDKRADREKTLRFWTAQRAAMDKMKREGDISGAVELFREALELNPDHGDSRYYLANCLAALDQLPEALEQLREHVRRAPSSQRGHRQLGVLLALTAKSPEDLQTAEDSLQRAVEINPEETGAMLALGEVALIQGDLDESKQRLEWVSRTNSQSVGALFLRGYIAWRQNDGKAALELLEKAQAARGDEWKPEGTTAEGDVAVRMHQEMSPLAKSWEGWDGSTDIDKAFGELQKQLVTR